MNVGGIPVTGGGDVVVVVMETDVDGDGGLLFAIVDVDWVNENVLVGMDWLIVDVDWIVVDSVVGFVVVVDDEPMLLLLLLLVVVGRFEGVTVTVDDEPLMAVVV